MATAKTKTVTTFTCDKCGHTYSTQQEAEKCESREVMYNYGVKEGDVVTITSGAGTGSKAKVNRVYVIDKDWGHYAWERYWHTVGLDVDILDESGGSRGLTFDSYKV